MIGPRLLDDIRALYYHNYVHLFLTGLSYRLTDTNRSLTNAISKAPHYEEAKAVKGACLSRTSSV